ncbi:hypothetical protein TWF481_002789 [Arthrobotrys musiformis]|uniref:Uncharacterized protein n=1 Tax=Arthrobotrys musiformis TaxID=47236 RepID=A0AAV9VU51_9PEZI
MSTRERRKELLSPKLEYLQTNIFHQPLDAEKRQMVADSVEYYTNNLSPKSKLNKSQAPIKVIQELLGIRETSTWKRIRYIVQSIHEEYIDFHNIPRFTNITLVSQLHLFRVCDAILSQDTLKDLPQHPEPIMAYVMRLLCNHIDGTSKTSCAKKRASKSAAISAQGLESSNEI